MKAFLKAKWIAVLMLVCIAVAAFSGCSTMKEPIDEALFAEVLETREFEVLNLDDEIEAPMIGAVTAISPEGEYQIELVTYSTAEEAATVFNWGKSMYENMASSNKVTTNVRVGNTYGSFSLKVSGMYYRILQAQNTVLASVAPAEYSDAIEEIIDAFKEAQ